MKVLVVDDTDSNRYMIDVILRSRGHEVVTAANGVEALELLDTTPCDFILSDILMPKMDGYRFCHACRLDPRCAPIPFVFITSAYTDAKDEAFALSLGADAFIRRPIDPEGLLAIIDDVVARRLHGGETVVTGGETGYLTEYNERLVRQLEKKIEELEKENVVRRLAEEEIRRSQATLERALQHTIEAVAATIEVRDPYTAGHQRRVADIAVAIGRRMGLGEDRLKGLFVASIVHDIGKIGIPSEILTRPGRLTTARFALIQEHPDIGYRILKDIEFPWPIADIVRQHHERLDGSGYPQGRKNGEVLLEARILAVADILDAITTHRPYRAALDLSVAIAELTKNRGSHYDPVVVDTCLHMIETGELPNVRKGRRVTGKTDPSEL
ncbi:MAG: response regulator [Alphaproteobacteria bacterium]